MNTRAFSAASALTTAPTRTSRTVVIGLGNFGLQSVGLLLPRLETHYRFAVPETTSIRVLARCGLIGHRPGEPEKCLALERPTLERAIAHAGAIQRAVLLQEAGGPDDTAEQIKGYLKITAAGDASVRPETWAVELARPVLADSWDYTSSHAHLNAYVVASTAEKADVLVARLAAAFAALNVPTTFNLILRVDTAGSAGANGHGVRAMINAVRRIPQSGGLDRQIYLVGQSKVNRTLTELPGEAAMTVCNFLDAMIFSALGDILAEQAMAIGAGQVRRTTFSMLGAAKLYVPIAETFDDIVKEAVSGLLLQQLAADFAAQSALCGDELDPRTLCRIALRGFPARIEQQSARVWRPPVLFPKAQAAVAADDNVRRRQLITRLPRIVLDRDSWRATLRKHGRRVPVHEWWPALKAYQDQIEQQIQAWPGATPNLTQHNPSRQLRNHLSDQEVNMRNELSKLVAGSPAGLDIAIGRLHQLKQQYEDSRQALDAWNEEERMTGSAVHSRPSQDQRLQPLRQQLTEALRDRPYPAAVLWRVVVFWLLPLFLMTVVLAQEGTAPMLALRSAVLGWTLLWVAIYALIHLISAARIWIIKRRIERLIFADLDREIERHFYSNGLEGITAGPLAVYLNELHERMLAPPSSTSAQGLSLLGALEQTAEKLRRDSSTQRTSSQPPECVVYQSVGQQITRSVLESCVTDTLQNVAMAWTFSEEQIRQRIDSPGGLAAYIRTTLHESVMRRYLAAVRTNDLLKLHSILQLPEHRKLSPGIIVDDLRQRAKPLLGFMQQSHASLQSMVGLEFLSADHEALAVLTGMHKHHDRRQQYMVTSCDPFGASYIAIALGIRQPQISQLSTGGTVPASGTTPVGGVTPLSGTTSAGGTTSVSGTTSAGGTTP